MIDANYKGPIILVVLVILGILAYGALTMSDHRDTSDKISDAYHDLQDRTPGQKLGDDIKHIGDKVKDNAQPSDDKSGN